MKKTVLPRLWFAAAIVCLCVLGIGARRWNAVSPNFFNTFFPDTAWTMAVYCGFGVLLNRNARVHLPAALAVSYAVELSQLIQTPLLMRLRATAIGGLVLGYGFLWSDLVCYTLGALLCGAAETLLRRSSNTNHVGM